MCDSRHLSGESNLELMLRLARLNSTHFKYPALIERDFHFGRLEMEVEAFCKLFYIIKNLLMCPGICGNNVKFNRKWCTNHFGIFIVNGNELCSQFYF